MKANGRNNLGSAAAKVKASRDQTKTRRAEPVDRSKAGAKGAPVRRKEEVKAGGSNRPNRPAPSSRRRPDDRISTANTGATTRPTARPSAGTGANQGASNRGTRGQQARPAVRGRRPF